MNSTAKYPISDEDMKVLLEKYPFLRYRNLSDSNNDIYKSEQENLDHNHYKDWDGTGWEDLWKNRYLKRLFAAYDACDEETKNGFRFVQVKSKYGGMRIYVTYSIGDNLESKAEMLSEWICENCGAEPRDVQGRREIWTTQGWIMNMCRDCALKYLATQMGVTETPLEASLPEMHHVPKGPFGYIRFSKNEGTKVTYRETEDGWLEEETVEPYNKEVTNEDEGDNQ